ncbi:hypothetical protein TREMEDRAFT_24262 [Tremella mesenterica DSM 1558]|uniref:uncharacterized protein n=1 Tax=Tremella mesenterica (strain ATCC 24925 / CBS 8224 / DSM 1558 / NBRC 9311 / NRRL Y-6157 / RJB 2259-6 / UBC 559-6) TaxID=578456 RepID=UPI0003F48EE0|nr:uncharacterized protein TREMEDRAFT_24262 [Tremella mesenterica DSM 1558]EIW73381.1 hypothetical protein TREMEDRAFT_24262 [Tremella mesenterica DSM 1558]
MSTIVLVTGANTGLGLEIVRALFNSSVTYTLILACRSLDKAIKAIELVKNDYPESKSEAWGVELDVENDESIKNCFEVVSGKVDRLDVLVNNAGKWFSSSFYDTMSIREIWNKTWDINVTGTHIVTHTFAPLLLSSHSPRLLFITSGVSSLSATEDSTLPLDRPPPPGWPKDAQLIDFPAYRSSKTGMNMLVRQWTRLLKEDGVKVFAVSPGLLATGLGGMGADMMKKMGAEDPKVGGEFVRDVVEGKQDEFTGKVIRRAGVQPW